MRRDPDASVAAPNGSPESGVHSERLGRETVGSGREARVGEDADAARRREDQRAVGHLRQSDRPASQSTTGIDVREPPAQVPDEVLLFRDDPERTRAILVERNDPVAWQFRRVAGVVHCEANAVEAHDTIICAEPEVAVARLDDRRDGVDRQPIGDRPVLAHIVDGRGGRLCGRSGGEREDQRRENRPPKKRNERRGCRGGWLLRVPESAVARGGEEVPSSISNHLCCAGRHVRCAQRG